MTETNEILRRGRAIVDAALSSERAWHLLEELCTEYGPRLCGSDALDGAVAWARDELEGAGHENVGVQPVMVPSWKRGAESLEITAPTTKSLAMLGIGMSVGTPPDGVEADVVVLESDADLAARRADLEGKIALWNVPMDADPETGDPGYGAVVKYRLSGADMVEKYGAVAMLIRSLTGRSLYTPHTGMLYYRDRSRAIPAAAITVEDADRITRWTRRGKNVRVRLSMGARLESDVESGNVVAEIVGREKPDEVVVLGGHIDGWDVGEGAHDDGAGVAISMAALDLLRATLPEAPRRTIRVVLWTNEENGLRGAKTYAADHGPETHVAAIESDSGAAPVYALGLHHRDPAVADAATGRFSPVAELFEELGVAIGPGPSGADVKPLVAKGVLGIGLRHEESRYFDFHHSAADTFDKIDAGALRQGVAAMALLAWWAAESDERLDGR